MTISLSTFTAPDADAILRSSDQDCPTDFCVHRCILSAASPFFADLFSLPQNPADLKIKSPIIPVSEDHLTLETLLHFVYPVPDPILGTLDELVPILGAAVKYDFTAVIDTLRRQLVHTEFLLAEPTRVYAIACRYDLEEEAKLASSYTLGTNILDAPLNEDLKHITAHSYHRLLELHRRRSRSAIELLKIPDNIKCAQCNGSSLAIFGTPKWWGEFEKKAKEELSVRPISGPLFELGFLASVANSAGCQRCAGSVLDSWRFLQTLKKQIDDLPSTV
ncbi:hypothetical protein BDN72DRAFT_406311 [Pluteus cervinus]|uniref:Uncharacterized protein n=1 Tax=Pluteus cervinus TaxID=181527 RepID=A0ACD3A8B2_9AGAR|nr:hypothetical protein BDN72DRAFT_406311 [Pluteus cervinus]